MVYKVEKVDDVILTDSGAKNKTKTKSRYESRRMVLKIDLGSRLD